MSVFIKKLEKHAKDSLEPGEQFRAAINLQRPGGSATTMGAAMGGVVGGLVGAAVDSKQAKKEGVKDESEGRPWAAKFPKWGAIVGVTDRRLMFWSASSGTAKPTELFLERPLAEVTLEAEKQKSKLLRGKPKSTDMTFRFSDGTMFRGTAITMGPAGKAVQEFLGVMGAGA